MVKLYHQASGRYFIYRGDDEKGMLFHENNIPVSSEDLTDLKLAELNKERVKRAAEEKRKAYRRERYHANKKDTR